MADNKKSRNVTNFNVQYGLSPMSFVVLLTARISRTMCLAQCFTDTYPKTSAISSMKAK